MKDLEIEIGEMECQLVCHQETEEEVDGPAVWGGTTLTTSAVWGGKIPEWESAASSEESPLLHTTAVWVETTP
jgi:hypothetical protein